MWREERLTKTCFSRRIKVHCRCVNPSISGRGGDRSMWKPFDFGHKRLILPGIVFGMDRVTVIKPKKVVRAVCISEELL